MTLRSRLVEILKEIDNGHEQDVERLMFNLCNKLRHVSGIHIPPGTPVTQVTLMVAPEYDGMRTLSVGMKPHVAICERKHDSTVGMAVKVVIPFCDILTLNGARWSQHMLFTNDGAYSFCIKMEEMVDHNCTFDYETINTTLISSFGNIHEKS